MAEAPGTHNPQVLPSEFRCRRTTALRAISPA